ncbi:hypothetical protein JVT61DRAFT_12260 [Boletus reticuloceps]|uniref:Uncharacterized protein n=1 Tax=Boletus reticuloceps TaxID=495285 RepID=A0A8I2YED9_9AGAM|nr:hypothetical protein JVT61DRAFT_12260 [Boletus reticuloceps]
MKLVKAKGVPVGRRKQRDPSHRSPASFQPPHLPIYLRPPRERLYLGTHPLGSLNNHQRHCVHMDCS